MNSFINRYATPLVTGLFLVSAISGVALFFHWSSGTFHSMHEWLSMVLLVPFMLHIWKNWKALWCYVRRRTMLVALILSVLVALPFAATGLSGGAGGNPAFRVMPLMTQARLSDLAPVLGTTPETLVATLGQRGYAVQSPEQTLTAVAAASGRPANEVLFAVLPAP